MECVKRLVERVEIARLERQPIRYAEEMNETRYFLFTITNFTDTPSVYGIKKTFVREHRILSKSFTQGEITFLRSRGWTVWGSNAALEI